MKGLIKNLLREGLTQKYVMYHGTSHKITSFTNEFVGGKEATDQEGPGIYFISSLKNAQSYGLNVYKVELSPKKSVSTKEGKSAPLREIEWLIKQAPEWKDTAMNWHENPNVGYKLAANDMIQYNDNPHEQFTQVWFDFYRYNPVNYVKNMVKLGYDSIIITDRSSLIHNENDIIHIVVLNPAIINVLGVEN